VGSAISQRQNRLDREIGQSLYIFRMLVSLQTQAPQPLAGQLSAVHSCIFPIRVIYGSFCFAVEVFEQAAEYLR
jgi:hypothetical protein